MQSDAHTLTLTKNMLCDTHHLKIILSKTTVGWVKKRKKNGWREWRWDWNGNESENEKWRMENENEIVNEQWKKNKCERRRMKKITRKTHTHAFSYSIKYRNISKMTHPPFPPHNHILTIKDSKNNNINYQIKNYHI